jgi:hypothetical protein
MRVMIATAYFVLASGAVLFADSPKLRISVDAQSHQGDSGKMVSLLSSEFRKLDGVLVTDTQPEAKVTCVFASLTRGGAPPTGYAASIAVTGPDDRLVTHSVYANSTLEKLAHEIALGFLPDISPNY